MERREPVALGRAVEATQIPSGFKVVLPQGARVTVEQVLGGNLTAMTDQGGLVRIAQEDADALGPEWVEASRKAAAAARAAPADPGAPVDEARVREVLGTIYDPEIPASIVELGLVYLAHVERLPEGDHKVVVRMTLTAPGCGIGGVLLDDVRRKVGAIPGVREVDVELVFDPPWDPSMMSEAARLQLGLM
ncbi:MAG TPA: putative Fe-S cluster assembly protein SufT [Anaeromyxobacteraceae bacterium]|nr:putative Fe-S cluster assembly protein SufT [Anaeromyxobacteraceae bacterium]